MSEARIVYVGYSLFQHLMQRAGSAKEAKGTIVVYNSYRSANSSNK